MNDLGKIGPGSQEDVLCLARVCQRRSHAEWHLERETDLPLIKIVVTARVFIETGGSLLVRDDGIEGFEGGPGHDSEGLVQRLAQPIELVEGIQA